MTFSGVKVEENRPAFGNGTGGANTGEICWWKARKSLYLARAFEGGLNFEEKRDIK
jgi:hypothetical protein